MLANAPRMTTMSRRYFVNATALLTVSWFALMSLWAVVTPAFRSPDAPAHFNSIMRVATGGGWPATGEARIDESTLIAMRESGILPDDRTSTGIFGFTTLRGGTIQGTGPGFWTEVPVPDGERTVLDFSAEDVLSLSDEDQMTQHPPLYYYLAAGILTMSGGLEWSWDWQLLFFSLVGILIMTPLVPLTVFTARSLGLPREWALVSAFLLVSVPQLAHIGASVTNDSLYILSTASVLAIAAHVMNRSASAALVVGLGVALGVALLTKALAIPLGLLVGLAFIFSTGNQKMPSKVLLGVASGTIGILVGGWWWIRNVIEYGVVQPHGLTPLDPDWGDQSPTLSEFLRGAYDRFFYSFWGNFGWLELPFPSWLVAGLTVSALALVVIGVINGRNRLAALILLLPLAVLMPILIVEGWRSYVATGLVSGLQGRYVFGYVPLLAVLATSGIAHVLGRSGRTIPGLLVVTSAGAVLGVLGLVTMTLAAYPDEQLWFAFDQLASWSPLRGWHIAAVAFASALTGLASLVIVNIAVRRVSGETVGGTREHNQEGDPSPNPRPSRT